LKKILDADVRMQTHLPPVLIQGETGTGKTTIARWLHQRGPRATQAFVEVNCSALPESLAESVQACWRDPCFIRYSPSNGLSFSERHLRWLR